MKKLTKEYSAKSTAELKKELDSVRVEIAKLQIEKSVKPAKDSNAIQKMKKKVAVMQTVIRQQELGIQK